MDCYTITAKGRRCYDLLLEVLERSQYSEAVKAEIEALINEQISSTVFMKRIHQFAPEPVDRMTVVIRDGITDLRQGLAQMQMGTDDLSASHQQVEEAKLRIKQEISTDDDEEHQPTLYRCNPCGKQFTLHTGFDKHQTSCKYLSNMHASSVALNARMYENDENAGEYNSAYFHSQPQPHANQFNGVPSGNGDCTRIMLNSLQSTIETVFQRMESMDASFIMKLNAVEERLNRKLDELQTLVGRIDVGRLPLIDKL